MIMGPGAASADGALVVYWLPTSATEARASQDLLSSRYLTLVSGQCVGMAIVTTDNREMRGKLSASTDGSVVVLAAKDGTELARVQAAPGKLESAEVEKMLRAELDKREGALDQSLDAAKEKASSDKDAAAALYHQVWEQRCLFPGPAKKAAKALKKMGKPVEDTTSSNAPDLSEKMTAAIVSKMDAGLAAEQSGEIFSAKRMYQEAMEMDPADPVPVRFLAELHRHETGEWDLARTLFEKVLTMRADPISHAVALHGLGKMTIHDGDFAKGVNLFEQSIAVFPLALTYRNLAVYWNSERNPEKAYAYVHKAIELDPEDGFNQIFAATYLVELGRAKEAEEILHRNESVLPASYNLAVIYAQLGNRGKALELLRRHFFEYEKFDAVRAKEMQEARDDIAFAKLHQDPDFVKLTAMAESDPSSYHRKAS
jgi:tetratricopeptide (TPR) repeat protein